MILITVVVPESIVSTVHQPLFATITPNIVNHHLPGPTSKPLHSSHNWPDSVKLKKNICKLRKSFLNLTKTVKLVLFNFEALDAVVFSMVGTILLLL